LAGAEPWDDLCIRVDRFARAAPDRLVVPNRPQPTQPVQMRLRTVFQRTQVVVVPEIHRVVRARGTALLASPIMRK